MVPCRLGSRPMMVRSSTDLPPPEAPTRPRISPRRTSSDRWSSTTRRRTRPRGRARGSPWSSAASIALTSRSRRRRWRTAPSSTITRKIDFTTEVVVCRPSDFGAALHPQAFAAGDDADHQRHERRLDHADLEMRDRDRLPQAGDEDRPGSFRHRARPPARRHRAPPSSRGTPGSAAR